MRNVVKLPVAPRLSGTTRLEYIMVMWRDLPFAQRVDRFYSVSSLHWHGVVEAERPRQLLLTCRHAGTTARVVCVERRAAAL